VAFVVAQYVLDPQSLIVQPLCYLYRAHRVFLLDKLPFRNTPIRKNDPGLAEKTDQPPGRVVLDDLPSALKARAVGAFAGGKDIFTHRWIVP